jgi:hypothetical protein
MCSRPMIIGGVTGQNSLQMPLAEHNHMVETFPLIEPIRRSAYGFCHGLNGLDLTSPMPMPATRCRNTSP